MRYINPRLTLTLIDIVVHLGLPTLKYRRLRGDMIEVFKIIKHKYDNNVAPELIYDINKVTTENDFRLLKIEVAMILENFRLLIE